MRWKKLPLWLIGGIISTILLFLPLLILQGYFGWEILGNSFLFKMYVLLNKIPLLFNPPNQTIKLVWAFISYFAIGAIIGLVISKIKKD